MTQLLTDSEASEILRISVRQLIHFARRGMLPAIRLPDDELRFDPIDIEAWIQSRKQPVTEVTR